MTGVREAGNNSTRIYREGRKKLGHMAKRHDTTNGESEHMGV